VNLPAWIVVAAAITLAIPCEAQDTTRRDYSYITGDRLIGFCTNGDQSDIGICLGYIVGIADAMHAARASGGGLIGWQACVPPETRAEQLMDVAVRFIAAHPSYGQFSASGLVASALSDAFPCPLK
jgi:hypothetical protein